MVSGMALMFVGFYIIRNKKKYKGWLDLHKKVMAAGALLAGVGLITGITMVMQGSGVHLRVPHTWIGVLTLVFLTVTLVVGFVYIKSPGKRKKKLRPNKIWMGRMTIALMVVALAFGILTVLFDL
jgi:purine-cytosine permease-like protein